VCCPPLSSLQFHIHQQQLESALGLLFDHAAPPLPPPPPAAVASPSGGSSSSGAGVAAATACHAAWVLQLWLTLLVAAVAEGSEVVADQVVLVVEAAVQAAVQGARGDVDVAWVRRGGLGGGHWGRLG
jgi:hypothetical protein